MARGAAAKMLMGIGGAARKVAKRLVKQKPTTPVDHNPLIKKAGMSLRKRKYGDLL